MLIELNEREYLTVLAGLRALQQRRSADFSVTWRELEDIASNNGKVDSMNSLAIHDLFDRIQTPPLPKIGIGINLDGGLVQCVFTDRADVEIECIHVDYDVDDADLDEVTYVPQDDEDERDPESGSLGFVSMYEVDIEPDSMRRYRLALTRDNAATLDAKKK